MGPSSCKHVGSQTGLFSIYRFQDPAAGLRIHAMPSSKPRETTVLLLKAGGCCATEFVFKLIMHACHAGDVRHDVVEPVLHSIPVGSPGPAERHQPAPAGEVFEKGKGRSLINPGFFFVNSGLMSPFQVPLHFSFLDLKGEQPSISEYEAIYLGQDLQLACGACAVVSVRSRKQRISTS